MGKHSRCTDIQPFDSHARAFLVNSIIESRHEAVMTKSPDQRSGRIVPLLMHTASVLRYISNSISIDQEGEGVVVFARVWIL